MLKDGYSFTKATTNKVEFSAGINMNNVRINLIDKNNNQYDSSICNVEESCKNVILRDKNKQIR